jgi:anti-sigma regulatory factor (Ser/Thr protein kinase)
MFDSGALLTLREEVRECAVRSGISAGRAEDMVLAIHELAANAVVHDGGAGRLRVWKLATALHCQVDDGDQMRSPTAGPSRYGMGGVQPGSAPGPVSVNSMPSEKGHGLWVVRKLADRVKTLSGPHGTRVMIAFGLFR